MRFLICTAVLGCAAVSIFAGPPPDNAWQQMPAQQMAPQSATQPIAEQSTAPQWTPDQLRNLVAPVALYPDPLLGEILAASTYPLEIVEAQQWIQQNPGVTGQALLDALKRQGWDPSVQMLAEFPEAMTLLNRDVRWTTDLGNAFLSQQGDVMNAIQYLRMEARDDGRLQSTPQQVVSTETENGQSAVSIEPASPQVIYPPVYSPVSVWGQPAYGSYPAFSYAQSPYYGGGYDNGYGNGGYGFGNGIDIGGLFSGLLNWNGWGWVLGWFNHSLSLASVFFNLLGFHGLGGGIGGGIGAGFYGPGSVGAGTMALWSHDPLHRMGVPYPRGFNAPQTARGFSTPQMARGFMPMRESSSRMIASTSSYSASRTLSPSLAQQRYNEPQRFGGSQLRTSVNPERYNEPVRFSGPQRERFSPSNNLQQRYSSLNYSPQRYTSSNSSPQRYSGQRSSGPQTFAPPRSYPQSFAQPKFSAPGYSRPKYSEPKYSAQKFSAPRFSGPGFSSPKFSAPKFSAPKAPKISAPKGSGGHSSAKSHKH